MYKQNKAMNAAHVDEMLCNIGFAGIPKVQPHDSFMGSVTKKFVDMSIKKKVNAGPYMSK